MAKVAVAMSGGVDSSVAAALLKQAGYEIVGVTMKFWSCADTGADAEQFDGCCGIRGTRDARKVADVLGIRHYLINFGQVFEQKVINDFCLEYVRGRTPNPCIRCNQHIKFDAFLKWSRSLGLDYIATGHYARIKSQGDRFILQKGIDTSKDQSYALYPMTQDQLKHTLFPLGDRTKEEVRQIAHNLGLPVADKAESQEICFIPDRRYPQFVQSRIHSDFNSRPGPILDKEGKVLGEHRGIINYTIGQRRGLGIAAKDPFYVIGIDPGRNAVIVGRRQETYSSGLLASDVNWIAFQTIERPIRADTKIRYKHEATPALISRREGGTIEVQFEQPQMAITPGQSVVFYDGDMVLGGGIIECSL